MVKPYRIALAILCALSAAYHSASAANPPKVVFIGDYLTANWPLPANSNWTNLGYPTPDTFQASGSSSYWLSNFQSIIDLHPDIVHILVGAEDAAIVDDGVRPIFGSIFANNIESMVAQAKTANIKVILGTTPAGAPDNIGITQINAFVEAYGAATGVPVINYADALCTCVNSTLGLGNGNAISGISAGNAFPPLTQGQTYLPQPLIAPDSSIVPVGFPAILLPTSAGYALMTQMVQNAIATTTGATLKSGYLQDIDFGEGIDVNANTPLFNQNTVVPGNTLQFTPWGTYSDGITRPLLNSNFAGSSGTWTSNNPSVMYVTQTGIAYALSPGTAWISYVSPEGVGFSPWVMTVNTAIP